MDATNLMPKLEFQSVTERQFDHISAIYHLMADASQEQSSSAYELVVASTAPAWPSLNDNQQLEKVNFYPLLHTRCFR